MHIFGQLSYADSFSSNFLSRQNPELLLYMASIYFCGLYLLFEFAVPINASLMFEFKPESNLYIPFLFKPEKRQPHVLYYFFTSLIVISTYIRYNMISRALLHIC